MTALEIRLLTWVAVGIVIVLSVLWIATWREYDFTAPSTILTPAQPPRSP